LDNAIGDGGNLCRTTLLSKQIVSIIRRQSHPNTFLSHLFPSFSSGLSARLSVGSIASVIPKVSIRITIEYLKHYISSIVLIDCNCLIQKQGVYGTIDVNAARPGKTKRTYGQVRSSVRY
jgi:hypothetical protein